MFLWGGLGGGGSLPQSPPLVAALPPPENVGAYGDRELSSPPLGAELGEGVW